MCAHIVGLLAGGHASVLRADMAGSTAAVATKVTAASTPTASATGAAAASTPAAAAASPAWQPSSELKFRLGLLGIKHSTDGNTTKLLKDMRDASNLEKGIAKFQDAVRLCRAYFRM